MPPKFLFTKDQVIQAALDLVRDRGMEGLTARALAEKLGCSVKPIFTLFENMEQVQRQTLAAAHALYRRRLDQAMAQGQYPPYKASGLAYIRFAGEERRLFQLLFMRDRSRERQDAQREEAEIQPLVELLQRQLGLDRRQARLFHLEMWVYVHGIAAMLATGYLNWDLEFASQALTDGYLGLAARFREKAANPADATEGRGQDGSHPHSGPDQTV